MKKLIAIIPTGSKSLKEILESVDKKWPEIQEKLNEDTESKKPTREE